MIYYIISRYIIFPKSMNSNYEISNKIRESKLSIKIMQKTKNNQRIEKNRKNIEHDLILTKKPLISKMKLNYVDIKNNNSNDTPKISKNENKKNHLLTLEIEDISRIKINRYLNHFRKVNTENGNLNKCKIGKVKGNQKDNLKFDNNSMNLNNNIFYNNRKCLIKEKNTKKIITQKYSKEKEKFINNNNTLKISTLIRSNRSELNNIVKIKFFKRINNTSTKTNNNKLDYLKNNNKLKLNNDVKISLMNKNNLSDNKNNFHSQKQGEKENENFGKKELKRNTKNQKQLENSKINRMRMKKGSKLFINKNSNFQEVFQPNKKNFHKKVNSMKYHPNHSELRKALQKYFSLSPSELLIPDKSKLTMDYQDEINYKKNDNSINSTKNGRLNNIFTRKIKIIKVENHNKLLKFKKKIYETNNNPIKSFYSQELDNDRDNLNYQTQANNILDDRNKKIYLGNNNNKSLALNKIWLNNEKKFLLNRITKSKSLNLYELDDYIGPNQYRSIIIPYNNKKIRKMIAEKKENEINKQHAKFKTEETKRNKEFFFKIKNRQLKCYEDYYNDKYLKKLVLSSEKTSKFFPMRNLLYKSAFKKCKN